jgi:hypothetical protein
VSTRLALDVQTLERKVGFSTRLVVANVRPPVKAGELVIWVNGDTNEVRLLVRYNNSTYSFTGTVV